jgi:hypothetical protein
VAAGVTSTQRTRTWLRGGTDGNELLTVGTGALLFVLLAALGVTILLLGTLIEAHLIIGLVLVPPVLLKLASTGWRLVHYYSGDPRYVAKGPPPLALRLLGPLVALATLVVFGSGIVLLFEGPQHDSTVFLVHKASFFVWIAVTAIHVVGHIPEMARGLGEDWGPSYLRADVPGRSGRAMALAGAIVFGVVLAIALSSDFAAWNHFLSVGV